MDRAVISSAAERNKGPILEVLRKEFAGTRRVLEIGSGTGQHAIFFGAAMPHLTWQTSDLAENHAAIRATLESGPANVATPLELDVACARLSSGLDVDAAFSANTAHIMSIGAVSRMFDLVGSLLPPGGLFCLYGPFNIGGTFSSESNAVFDESLRLRDSSMGLRDLEELDGFGRAAKLTRVRLYAMPANNHLAVWQKSGKGEATSGDN